MISAEGIPPVPPQGNHALVIVFPDKLRLIDRSFKMTEPSPESFGDGAAEPDCTHNPHNRAILSSANQHRIDERAGDGKTALRLT